MTKKDYVAFAAALKADVESARSEYAVGAISRVQRREVESGAKYAAKMFADIAMRDNCPIR